MVRLKQEGYKPTRGIKLALTCGEETPDAFNGVSYLIEHYRALMDAYFALKMVPAERPSGDGGNSTTHQ
jgi:acetylornithine deacetylase/succinyl-diaminopimelate desuccinylase-like protein